MYVKEFFVLNERAQDKLYFMVPKFGYNGYGELVYYRTYSRLKHDKSQEQWPDTVLRVINGVMTIRKDWYIRNFINWDEKYWQDFAEKMAISMFNMHWLPPGRGLWAMGTNHVFKIGSMALNNCGYVTLRGNKNLGNAYHWMMDVLMLGVGVGFGVDRDGLEAHKPQGEDHVVIADSREGWIDTTMMILNSYLFPDRRRIIPDYSEIRPEGAPIKGFGGKASGPEPLKVLHKQIAESFDRYSRNMITETQLKTDIANQIGKCVVAGNVRRSAELGMASINNRDFMNLKDYAKYPERAGWGYMSNNSVVLKDDDDFERTDEVARRVIDNQDLGIANLRNFKRGRLNGKKRETRRDNAIGLNPCGEITLEDYELCNLVKTFPTACPKDSDWFQALKYATFYASTTSLLPTHRPETNAVVGRNRRIGVDYSDHNNWVQTTSLNHVIRSLRTGYKIVRRVNKFLASEAGVPESIKVTTVAPGGTVPKLVGVVSGIGYPTFNETLRRTTVAVNHDMRRVLDDAGVPCEPSVTDPKGTLIYEYPIYQKGTPASQVTLWEQAVNLVIVQREWADNAVSNTLYYKPMWEVHCSYTDPNAVFDTLDDYGYVTEHDFEVIEKMAENQQMTIVGKFKLEKKWGKYQLSFYNNKHEENEIPKVLAYLSTNIKSCSLLPHTKDGAYQQMPESGLTSQEYTDRLEAIGERDWSEFSGSDGIDNRYCVGDTCELTFGGK